MKFESNDENHIVKIEVDADKKSAKVYNCLRSSVHVEVVDSTNSDSVEARLTILKGNGTIPEIFVTEDAINISTTGLWEISSLAASLLAAAELLEPGIIGSINQNKAS